VHHSGLHWLRTVVCDGFPEDRGIKQRFPPNRDGEGGTLLSVSRRRVAAEPAERMRASAEEYRQLRHSLNQEDACVAKQCELAGKAIKLMHDPLPNAF
jgi:hypothetical protein